MDALMLVDLQNDFCPGGALAVEEGDQVMAVANRLMDAFDLVVATRDWHPEGHCSFITQHPDGEIGQVVEHQGLDQIIWPVHCVRETEGAKFHADLDMACVDEVINKGEDLHIDSYSGFFDNGRRQQTRLADLLRERGVERVYIMGLATDYCVKFTALDAASLGFETYLVLDGCRGVDLNDGDIDAAIEAMKDAGVTVTSSRRVLKERQGAAR